MSLPQHGSWHSISFFFFFGLCKSFICRDPVCPILCCLSQILKYLGFLFFEVGVGVGWANQVLWFEMLLLFLAHICQIELRVSSQQLEMLLLPFLSSVLWKCKGEQNFLTISGIWTTSTAQWYRPRLMLPFLLFGVFTVIMSPRQSDF